MRTENTRSALREACKTLLQLGPRYTGISVCGNVVALIPDALVGDTGPRSELSDYEVELADACLGWEHYSGNDAFPVPTGDSSYMRHYRLGTLWTGEQGELRKSLLEYLIRTLEWEA